MLPLLFALPLPACQHVAELCSSCCLLTHVQNLDLTANRLRSLEPNLLALTRLRRLCLRQNLVSQTAEVEALACAPGER